MTSETSKEANTLATEAYVDTRIEAAKRDIRGWLVKTVPELQTAMAEDDAALGRFIRPLLCVTARMIFSGEVVGSRVDLMADSEKMNELVKLLEKNSSSD